MNRTRKKPTVKKTGTPKQTNKRQLDRLVHEAVQKVITEYGEVLRRLGKEE